MRKLALTAAALAGLMATSCYKDFDFNGDALAEHTYVDANGDWWNAETGGMVYDGLVGDIPVPGDYDANNNWDTAVVRANGDWVTNSTAGTINFPAPPQLPAFVTPAPYDFHVLPVPGDYDGDGTDDPAWYRDTDGTWSIEGVGTITFGQGPTEFAPGEWATDQDFPVPADYDGDGTTDLAVYSPATMDWSVRSSATGTTSTVTMSENGDSPMPIAVDLDGVGHAQRVLAGPNGWFVEGGADIETFGVGDFAYPAAADFSDPNGVDLAYVSVDGEWKTEGSATVYGGQSTTLPYSTYPVVTGRNLLINLERMVGHYSCGCG
jgi:hypothetical protein